MDLGAVRCALAHATRGVDNLDSYSFIPGSIAAPALAVGRMQITYNTSFGGLVEAAFAVHAFASIADAQDGQDAIVELLAAYSVKAAIEEDRTLGGACQELRVESADGPGISEVGGQQYWSATWTVRVWG